MKTTKAPILNTRQSQLVVDNYALVQKAVNSIRPRLPQYADLDDLHSAGVSGLIDASLKLDLGKLDTFAAYASMRIRGAIIDEIRKLDYMPRSARQDAKKISRIRNELEQNLGREASDEELREALHISSRQFAKVLRRTQNFSFTSINDYSSNDGEGRNLSEVIRDESASTAVENIERAELSKLLKTRISSLPEKMAAVLKCYYFEEKKLSEIAKQLQLSEARVCQIHAQAIRILRKKMMN